MVNKRKKKKNKKKRKTLAQKLSPSGESFGDLYG